MLILFTLVTLRLSGLWMGMPVFNRDAVPIRYRVLLIAALAPVLLPIARPEVLPSGADVFPAMVSEVVIGYAIGLSARLLVSSFQVAGQIMGFQMGLAMANIFDPETEDQTSVISSAHLNLVGVLFLLLDGHHLLIHGVAASYQALPIGAVLDTGLLAQSLFHSANEMWEMGARIAGPITALMLLVNVLLGFLNRVIPQLSIFNVGLPMTVVIGLTALSIALPGSVAFFLHAWDDFGHQLASLLAK